MKKILLIDSSSFILNVLSDFFSSKNQFELYYAKDMKEVEKLIEKEDFFVAVSSLVLPNTKNGEAIELLKKHSVPTIILSSVINDHVVNSASKYFVVDYVSKSSVNQLEYVCNLIELLVFMENKEVLVVEDSKISAKIICDLLQTIFLKAHISSSGEEALNILETNKNISLIISDHYMENLDGLEFVKKLRSNKSKYSRIPVIMITTGVSNKVKIDFFKNSITDFLEKPILQEELKAKIIGIFSNKKNIEDVKKFNKIIDQNVIIATIDNLGIITQVSKSFCDISGYSKEELLGKSYNILINQNMHRYLDKEIQSSFLSANKWQGEINHIRKDSSSYWIKAIVEVELDSSGNIVSYTLIGEDITDKKTIYELSITDGLTSLYNKRYFSEVMPKLLKDNLKNNKIFVLLIMDIDNFKKYNDTYGHQAGDNVLTIVSASLRKSFKRYSDMIFRLGGEEFGVIFSTKTAQDAINLAERTRGNIEKLGIKHEANTPYSNLTASFGLNIVSKEDDIKNLNVDTIYKLADFYLYKAKDLGRNRVEYRKD